MFGFHHKIQRSIIFRLFSLFVLGSLLLTQFISIETAKGQGTIIRAEAIVIVNSSSIKYEDFAFFIQPYLEHFGIPYAVLDISTVAIPSNLGDYALIIIGHDSLDPNLAFIDIAEQNLISTAVNQGTGLVNFDSELVNPDFSPRYQYVQDIFGFSYGSSGMASNVVVNTDPGIGSYVVAAQPASATYGFLKGITPTGVTYTAESEALVTVGGQPLLVVSTSGLGHAVQWTSYEWMHADAWGYVRGFDDLIWRGLVWAARKPFVMQGLPPFVGMRVDDAMGPYWWVDIANQYGLKPWSGLFLHDQDQQDINEIKQLVDAGQMTVSIHSFADASFFYFDDYKQTNFSDQVVAQHFAEGTAWHTNNQIPISKYVVPHFYEYGSNVFAGLQDWGVEFIGTVLDPGDSYGDLRLYLGPFNRYEIPCNSDCEAPLYYADFLPIPDQPAFDNKFFVLNTEIRDNAGYEWYPNNDVPGTIDRGVTQLKRALDGMNLSTLFTHEYYLQGISPANWHTILSGITTDISTYQPIYVTMDYASQYIRAVHTSNIAGSVYDPQLEQLNTILTGSTDIETQFYLFVEQNGEIQSTFVDVPVFSGSVPVSVSTQLPTPTATFTPTNTATFTPTVSATYVDSFDSSTLGLGWSFVDPMGNSSYSLTSNPGHLELSVPAGTAHDCWGSEDNCTRMMRSVAGGDAVYEVKIDGNALTTDYQVYGILLFQNNNNYMRFEYWRGIGNVYVMAWQTVNGNSSTAISGPIVTLGSTNSLRVTRTGNTYLLEYKLGSGTWQTAGSFTQSSFVPSQAGIEVINAGANLSTSANVDYFSVFGSAPANTPTFTPTNTATFTPTNTPVPPTATYTPTYTFTPTNTATFTPTNTPTNTPSTRNELIYISSTSNGNAGGIAFNDEDILVYDSLSETWSMYFDGSDVGVTGDVNAFALLPDGSILLSFDSSTNVGGLGIADDSDIIRFIPTSLGENTSGTFIYYLVGADYGLTTNGEDIDAIDFTPDGRLIISTGGSYSVLGASGGDEDLIVLNTNGLDWALYFDGSDVGLNDSSSEEINGVWIDPTNNQIYLTTVGSFAVTGVNGDGSDIFICTPSSLGSTTSCTFISYWLGSSNGFSGEIIDGLDIVRH